MRHLDLFSGIGGFALAARWVGWETVGFCEIDPYCQKVLAKHWPDVPIHDDVRKLDGRTMGHVDIITGGYPCQPFSVAGKRRGAADDRHLWPEFARLIREIKPRWAVGENVAGHINMGLDDVLSDLEGLSYTTETFVIPACAVDAHHRRDRVWIVAHRDDLRGSTTEYRQDRRAVVTGKGNVANASGGRCGKQKSRQDKQSGRTETVCTSEIVADTEGQRCRETRADSKRPKKRIACSSNTLADTNNRNVQGQQYAGDDQEVGRQQIKRPPGLRNGTGSHCQWQIEPSVGKLVAGLSARLARIRGLTNDQRWIQISCEKTAEECLRDLRKHKNALRSSHQSGLEEQRPIEFSDAVQFLSYITASCSGRHSDEEREVSLQSLRQNILSSGFVQHTSDKVEKIWQSLDDQEADWFVMATCLGENWTSGLIGRVATGVPNRTNRLKGLGNAVVPQIPEIIFRAINDYEELSA